MMVVPAPGSRDAQLFGCCCPDVENNFGAASPFDGNGWYLDADCYVHVAIRLHPFDVCDDA